MTPAPVRPGDILAAKYRVDRVLGSGNMGVVVAATHVEIGQRVALKFMLPQKAAEREQRERFLREARAAVRLKSQHVARVLDVGTLENDAPYIVMEFLEGQDLSAVLKARGPLPFDEAVAYILQACEAVGEAHAAGIIHRDIKPANLFLTEDVGGAPCIKVLDFGISKLTGVELTLTHEADMLGSPLYMSPEQMSSSRGVDARSDLWALGIVLYQLVAGRTPFHAESMAHLYGRIFNGDATPLGAYRPDAPPGFEAVIQRCLERDRAHRFPDVAAFAAALGPFAPEHARAYPRRVARVLGIKGAPAASAPEMTATPPAPAVTAYRRTAPSVPGVVGDTAITLASSHKAAARGARPRIVALGAALGVAALGAGGLWLALRPAPVLPTAPEPSAAAPATLSAPPAAPSLTAAAPVEPRTAAPTASAAPSMNAPQVTAADEAAPPASTASKPQGRASSLIAPAGTSPRPAPPPAARPAATPPPAAPAPAPPPPKRREGIL